MIEEQAIVAKIEGDYIWVQTQRKSSCGHCSAKNSCGTHVLSKILGNKTPQVRCFNALAQSAGKNGIPKENAKNSLKKGDQVMIALEESAILSGSFLIYFLPLVMMIISGGLGVYLASFIWQEGTDFLSVLASLLGLIVGLYVSQYLAKDKKHKFEPRLIRKIAVPANLLKISNDV
jgi:sigma-E factor negative regulatory protein RseC